MMTKTMTMITAMVLTVGTIGASPMGRADLRAFSASGYAYSQRGGGGLPAGSSIDRGSGRYYRAPAVRYVPVAIDADADVGGSDGGPAPVAPVARRSETASPHETEAVSPYATARHEITRPYSHGDGLVNYASGQSARYPLARMAGVPYYATSAFKPWQTGGRDVDRRNADHRTDDEVDDEKDAVDGGDGDRSGEGKTRDEDHTAENTREYAAAVDSAAESDRGVHDLDDPRPNIDVSLGGKEFSVTRNSAHGERSDDGYGKRLELDVGERGRHDNAGRREHYDAETRNERGYSDVAGNYGRYGEAEGGEWVSSYGQTSYRKKGQKTSGFHKVYRKDEYKNHTDFYDENHERGYFTKHAAADEYHDAAESDFGRGGHRESGFDRENSAKKGFHDVGRVENRDQSYLQEKGEDSFRNDYGSYDSDEDTRLAKEHGKAH